MDAGEVGCTQQYVNQVTSENCDSQEILVIPDYKSDRDRADYQRMERLQIVTLKRAAVTTYFRWRSMVTRKVRTTAGTELVLQALFSMAMKCQGGDRRSEKAKSKRSNTTLRTVDRGRATADVTDDSR